MVPVRILPGVVPYVSPLQASVGDCDAVPDADLPMLAAQWLVEGWDSEELVELAGLTRAESVPHARHLLSQVLLSLGLSDPLAVDPELHRPWRGRWNDIAWVQEHLGTLLAPYAAAQRILEITETSSELQTAARAGLLGELLTRWDEHASRRSQTSRDIRVILAELREIDCLTARRTGPAASRGDAASRGPADPAPGPAQPPTEPATPIRA